METHFVRIKENSIFFYKMLLLLKKIFSAKEGALEKKKGF